MSALSYLSGRKLAIGAMVMTIVALQPAQALAQNFSGESWTNFKSPSGIYQLRLPENHTTENTPFRISKDTMVAIEQTLATEKTGSDTPTRYSVRYEQTLMPPFSQDDINVLLRQDFETIFALYRDYDGILRQSADKDYENFYAGRLHIEYTDPELGQQAVRQRIIYTDSSRLVIAVTGTPNSVTTLDATDYLNSLRLYNGLLMSPGSFEESWTETVNSPLGVFSLRVPALHENYFPAPPTIQNGSSSEVVSMAFHDPVRHQNLYYNVYSHSFDQDLTYTNVQQVLTKRHFNKHGVNILSLQLKRTDYDNFFEINVDYPVATPEDFPYINRIRMRAFYNGGTIVVQELMGSQRMVHSEFADNVLEQIALPFGEPENAGKTTKESE